MAQPKESECLPGVVDWSTLHEPYGSRICGKAKESELNQFKWSQDKVKEFWRDGFVSNVPILTPEQCEQFLQECSYLMDVDNRHPGHDLLYEFHSNQSGDPVNVLVHCLGQWRMTEIFHDLIFHPKVVVPCSLLMVEGQEKAVRFWHDQFFAKPPKHGGNVAWHQDYSYWTRTTPMMHVTVHIALEDQTLENGTLHYIPGSHRWTRDGGKPLPVLDSDFKEMDIIKTILTSEELDNFKPVPSLLRKGEASFHHCLTVHGSYPNRSDKPRRATVLNYFADGVTSNTDSFMLKDEVNPSPLFQGSNIAKGSKMEGQFYPLVYCPI